MGIHSLMDRNKVPNPEFFFLQEQGVYFFIRKTFNIVQTIKNVELNVTTGVIIVPTFLYKMFCNSARFSFVLDVGFVISKTGFPFYCWILHLVPHILDTQQRTRCRGFHSPKLFSIKMFDLLQKPWFWLDQTQSSCMSRIGHTCCSILLPGVSPCMDQLSLSVLSNFVHVDELLGSNLGGRHF